jgi:predicted lipid-binding transport protein (Tim44 family)
MSTNLPSFDKAQYALTPTPGPDQCTLCQQPIAASYYRVNGDMACEPCATQAKPTLPTDSHAAFTRAVLSGISAAILGMIIYALFEIVTGIIIGYLAIGVGYLVGKAMKRGSNNRGGRRYQIVAALLTYASVSLAAIPVAIHSYKDHKPAHTTPAPSNATSNQSPFPAETAPKPEPKPQPVNLGMLLITLAGLGLASPFLELADGFGGIIGLFILFLGIRAAWSFTSGVDASAPDISGPYNAQPSTINAV